MGIGQNYPKTLLIARYQGKVACELMVKLPLCRLYPEGNLSRVDGLPYGVSRTDIGVCRTVPQWYAVSQGETFARPFQRLTWH